MLIAALRTFYPATADHERYHNKTFLCLYVVDGDTLDIAAPDGDAMKTRIRLLGVDTPESKKSPGGEMYYGEEAYLYARSLVEGQPVKVVLPPDRTRGKYGRLLAYVYLGDSDVMLNEELIIHGYGYADSRFKHPWRARFLQLEEKARKSQAGLWHDVTPELMPAWKREREAWLSSKAADRTQ